VGWANERATTRSTTPGGDPAEKQASPVRNGEGGGAVRMPYTAGFGEDSGRRTGDCGCVPLGWAWPLKKHGSQSATRRQIRKRKDRAEQSSAGNKTRVKVGFDLVREKGCLGSEANERRSSSPYDWN